MKLFLTTALLLSGLAVAAHSQTAYPTSPPPSYLPPPPPPQVIPPPPPPPPEAARPAPPAFTTEPQTAPPQSLINPSAAPATTQALEPTLGPAPQRQGNVTFVSGGTGEEERNALRQTASGYNLHLLFAARSGDYLANINVTVADARGRAVLDTIAEGPIFYAKLPPGRYRVTAANDGQSITRELTVPASGAASQDFYWSQPG